MLDYAKEDEAWKGHFASDISSLEQEYDEISEVREK